MTDSATRKKLMKWKTVFLAAALQAVSFVFVVEAQPLTTLMSFPESFWPHDNVWLIQGSDGNFYGANGGLPYPNYPPGVVFQVTPSGVFTPLYTFAHIDANLVQGTDGYLYGTTYDGGVDPLRLAPFQNGGGYGTTFKLSTNGSLIWQFSFDGFDGYNVEAPLMQASDGNFYGTTYDGGPTNIGSLGTVFQITPDGTLTDIYAFGSSNPYIYPPTGCQPAAGLTQDAGGYLYGTASSAGSGGGPGGGAGTVFKMTTNGTLIWCYTFPSSGTNGNYPNSQLVFGADGNLYGTTSYGGVDGVGSIYRITPDGDLTNLYSFWQGDVYPNGLVLASDGNIYGTTKNGGACGEGTIFEVSSNGDYSVLYSFCMPIGAYPACAMVQGQDGNLYGATAEGGTNYPAAGIIFQWPLSAPPFIIHQPISRNNLIGAAMSLPVLAGGTAPLSYQWQVNGANLTDAGDITESTNATLSFSDLSTNDAGSYTVVVSNAFGSITSAVAVVSPGVLPSIITQPVGQTNLLGSTLTLSVQAGSAQPMTFQWQMDGTNIWDNGDYSGTAAATLTFNSLTTNDPGSYTVIVSNPAGSITSAVAVVQGIYYAVTPLGSMEVGNGDVPTFEAEIGCGPCINNRGQVVGWTVRPGLDPPDGDSFLYNGAGQSVDSEDELIDLGALFGNTNVTAIGINDSGEIVGYAGSLNGGSDQLGFIYSGGTLTYLLRAAFTSINNSGQAVGTYGLYSGGTWTSVGLDITTSINDEGQITGVYKDHAAIYSGGTITDLGTLVDGTYSAGNAINNSGEVVGYSDTFLNIYVGSTFHAFSYSGGTMTDLGTLGNGNGVSEALGINNSGQIVGYSFVGIGPLEDGLVSVSNGPFHAFIYNGRAMADLNNLIIPNTVINLETAVAINDSGWIVAGGTGTNGYGTFLLTPAVSNMPLSIPPPTLQAASVQSNSFMFGWSATAGRSYQVQYQTNLAQSAWINFGPPMTASGATLSVTDAITNAQRFYRVVLLP